MADPVNQKILHMTPIMLHSLFNDRKFYEALPPQCADLRPVLEESYSNVVERSAAIADKATETAQGKAPCGACSKSLLALMAPATDALGKRVAEILTTNPQAMDGVKRLIALRANKAFDVVAIYYKDGVTAKAVRF